MTVRLEQLLAAGVDKKARETWWSLNRMSYTGGQPDLRKQDVEEIASLIRDLAGIGRDSSLADVLSGRPHRAIAEVHAANEALLDRLDALGETTA